MNMKKIFLIVLVQILGTITFAQVGVGISTPDASAAFQIEATNQGFLAPRVALTGLTDVTTIPSPATGLLVFCSGSTVLSNGYYVYNGTKWQPFSQVTNNQDLGYIVGWTSNVNSPDFLLPMNGKLIHGPIFLNFKLFTPQPLVNTLLVQQQQPLLW